MKELKCPYCNSKAKIIPFICQITELPKPIKLFRGFSIIKMRYRELPVKYTVECSAYCEGFSDSELFVAEDTREKAEAEWEKQANKICE